MAKGDKDKHTDKQRRQAEHIEEGCIVDVVTGLAPAPTVLSGANEFREFLTAVNVHSNLERLPEGPLRRRFVEELTERAAADDPPYSLDHYRLNISARRPEVA